MVNVMMVGFGMTILGIAIGDAQWADASVLYVIGAIMDITNPDGRVIILLPAQHVQEFLDAVLMSDVILQQMLNAMVHVVLGVTRMAICSVLRVAQ